jgi:hypothetical protein
VRKEQDSIGGVSELVAVGVPPGLGEPVFDKLKADLAKALLSLPAVMAFEYGAGFAVATPIQKDAMRFTTTSHISFFPRTLARTLKNSSRPFFTQIRTRRDSCKSTGIFSKRIWRIGSCVIGCQI